MSKLTEQTTTTDELLRNAIAALAVIVFAVAVAAVMQWFGVI